jgi:hypothetical protein
MSNVPPGIQTIVSEGGGPGGRSDTSVSTLLSVRI